MERLRATAAAGLLAAACVSTHVQAAPVKVRCTVVAMSPQYASDPTLLCVAPNGAAGVLLSSSNDAGRHWTTKAVALAGHAGNVRVLQLLPAADFATSRYIYLQSSAGVFGGAVGDLTLSPYSLSGQQAISDYSLTAVDALTPAPVTHGTAFLYANQLSASRLDPPLPVEQPVAGVAGGLTLRFLNVPGGGLMAVGLTQDPADSRRNSPALYSCTQLAQCAQQLASTPPGEFRRANVGPLTATGRTIVLQTYSSGSLRVFKSVDGGKSLPVWKSVQSILQPFIKAVAFDLTPSIGITWDPADARRVYLRVFADAGFDPRLRGTWIYRSDDGGQRWMAVASPRRPVPFNPPSPAGNAPSVVSEITALPGGRLVLTGDVGAKEYFFCSADRGRTWRSTC
jgi:hypothetical protein